MSKRIFILPLDNRPCHYDYLIQSTKEVPDWSIELPKRSWMGTLEKPAELDKITAYLFEQIKTIDVLIISMDCWVFGGLVQARSVSSGTLNQALERMKLIRELKQINPKVVINVYSVIMRLTVTTRSSADLTSWEQVFQYSQLAHRSQVDKAYLADFAEIKENLDPEILRDYLCVRERNHAVNRKCIDLLASNAIDFCVFTQEDTAEFGLHRQEQAALVEQLSSAGLSARSMMKNGADEMAALFLARVLSKGKFSIQIADRYIPQGYVSLYEDSPVLENLKKSLDFAGIAVDEQAKTVLMIPPVDGTRRDLCFEELPAFEFTEEQERYYDSFKGKAIALCDLNTSNGGDLRVLAYLDDKNMFNDLIGYSAWNTASNTIGTLVLDLVIHQFYRCSLEYLRVRMIDDAIYQGNVRRVFNQRMMDRGIDIWGNCKGEKVNITLQSLLDDAVAEVPFIQGNYRYRLPWNRSFELEVEVVK